MDSNALLPSNGNAERMDDITRVRRQEKVKRAVLRRSTRSRRNSVLRTAQQTNTDQVRIVQQKDDATVEETRHSGNELDGRPLVAGCKQGVGSITAHACLVPPADALPTLDPKDVWRQAGKISHINIKDIPRPSLARLLRSVYYSPKYCARLNLTSCNRSADIAGPSECAGAVEAWAFLQG